MNTNINNNSPKISVIIPVYKVEEYLRQCVDSVLNQTYTNLEVILVDDGSPDNCPDICDRYKEKDNRVIVIHKENGGLSSARNSGLDIASGDIISFVDSDDWLDLDMFERMIDLKIRTGADIVCCDWIRTDGTRFYEQNSIKKQYGDIASGRDVAKKILLNTIESYVWNSLYDRYCWEEIRFPIGRVFEDLAVTFLAFEKADKVTYIDEPFYKYRINNHGITRTPNAKKYYDFFTGFREHYEYVYKFYPEILKECCSISVSHTINVYLYACTVWKSELEQYSSELRQFMNAHRNEIDYKYITRKKRFALKIYYLSDSLFRFLCFIFYKTGLQKALHFDLK